ncbi:MAG TPA: hypothetical protein VN081_03840 [Dongiaceae bacterium]|nr:hypothetical protein [Dongiaceae bacterium]
MSNEQIQALYAALKTAQARLNAANEEQAAAQKDFDRLSSDLGDLLHVNGMSDVGMLDGKRLGLKQDYFGSTAQERMDDIRAYLERKNNAGILKPKKLNITEDDIAALPEDMKTKVLYEINTNTLKAFLRELAKKNEITDEVMGLFKVEIKNTVVIA